MKAIDVGLSPRCLGRRQGVKFNQKVSLNQLLPGFEPGLLDSESNVIATTLKKLQLKAWRLKRFLSMQESIPQCLHAAMF